MMNRSVVLLMSSIVAACAAPTAVDTGASRSDQLDEESSLSYGWKTPIKARDTDKNLSTKAGKAQNTIAGHSISQIVNSPKVRIRDDNEACVTCHSWAAWSDREHFCARIDDFLAMPTARDLKIDSAGAKPALLKKLLKDWRDADCPE